MDARILDFSRLPTVKERKAFLARLGRLQGSYGAMVQEAAVKLHSKQSGRGPLIKRGFRLRPAFSYQENTPTGDYSDRTVPPRSLRPPATRISSSRGSTLRLYLLALAMTQMEKQAGGQGNSLPVVGGPGRLGWTDLVATNAESHKGSIYIASKDKRARSVRSSLKTLEEAKLLEFAARTGKRGSFDKYYLLDETGGQGGTVEPYRVPNVGDSVLTLPSGFILKSWIQVLEDSEITLLLMIACGRGSLPGPLVAVPSDVRLLHYGIARDPYMLARKTLEAFGLIEATEVERHLDGRAEGEGGYFLHRFKIREEGFEEDALKTAIAALEHQLARK